MTAPLDREALRDDDPALGEEERAASVFSYCQLISCWGLIEQKPGRGRPRRYCTDEHRREAQNMRRQAEARLAHLRALARREEHLLAALGGEDDDA